MKKAAKKRPRQVRIAELKANLSKHLRAAQRGETVTVLDRDTPIARIVPYIEVDEPFILQRASGRLSDIPLPPPAKLDIDIVELLLEDRRDRVP